MQITTIGLDIAKSIFQVHGIDADGRVVVRKKLRRAEVLKFFQTLEPCLVGIEACATAHHWARELGAIGHEVRLMSPAYVKAYVRRLDPLGARTAPCARSHRRHGQQDRSDRLGRAGSP